eukprot:scaffold7099_cov281-Pinguiococcus_pyrenoidosus.AAC.30
MLTPNPVIPAVGLFILFGFFLCSCLTYNEDWDDFHWIERIDKCGDIEITTSFFNEKLCADLGSGDGCLDYEDVGDVPGSEDATEAMEIFRAVEIMVGINVALLVILFGIAASLVYSGVRQQVRGPRGAA